MYSVEKVGDELIGGADDLATWAQPLIGPFFLEPDAQVIPSLQATSAWATAGGYDPAAVNTFLQVADYYLVAHAHGHIVVTHEVVAHTTKRIKIPNACLGMSVRLSTPRSGFRIASTFQGNVTSQLDSQEDFRERARIRCVAQVSRNERGLWPAGGTAALIGAKARLRAAAGKDLASLSEAEADALIAAALRVGSELQRFDLEVAGDDYADARAGREALAWAGEDLDVLLRELGSLIPRVANGPLTAEQCAEAYAVAGMIAATRER